MKMRIGAVGIIKNSTGEVLLCKMPNNRGVYPGQWAIPGGGIDEGEEMEEALVREMKEEVGLEIAQIEPFWFQDDEVEKLYADGERREIYMIYLLFDCVAVNDEVVINEEFEDYAWVKVDDLKRYDLNRATRKTFIKKGWM
jgi:nucleoside triphosphatase